MSLDIVPADREKWLLRIAMNWFIKKYSGGKNADVIHDEMKHCGNPFIRYIMKLKNRITDNVKENYQVKIIDQVSEFMLWVLYKDTAYRQVFFWAMKQMLDDKEKLMPIIEKYYREPEDWYVNNWHDSKEITKKKREKGEIPNSYMSSAERNFVPSITHREIEKELEDLKKKKRIA